MWFFMPVQGGYGAATLDYLGARRDGRAFAVETKAHKQGPTDRQKQTIREMIASGVKVFLIDDEQPGKLTPKYHSIAQLTHWLQRPFNPTT